MKISMPMAPEVTIIIPCYKVGKYLRQCIDSVLNQSNPNIQVVAVNDASPDDCGSILDDFAARDSRLDVVHQAINSGVSVARNIGMSKAVAPFIMFLDGDDWLPADAVAKLLVLQQGKMLTSFAPTPDSIPILDSQVECISVTPKAITC